MDTPHSVALIVSQMMYHNPSIFYRIRNGQYPFASIMVRAQVAAATFSFNIKLVHIMSRFTAVYGHRPFYNQRVSQALEDNLIFFTKS